MTIHTNIQGILKLASPMHVADTNVFHINDQGYVNRGKGGRPVTATMQQSIMANDRIYSVPYFPANDLRGRLRRKAAAIVMDSLCVRDESISDELYSALCAGSASANPESDVTLEEIQRATSNVYMGLFGGGTRMLRSGYSVQDAVPMVASTVEAGLVPAQFGQAAEGELAADAAKEPIRDGRRLTDVRHILHVDDMMRVMRPEDLEKYLADPTASVAAHQEKVLANRKARKEDAAEGESTTTKTDIGNVVSVQNIIPGTPLYTRFDMKDSLTPAQVGLLLSALRDLINEQAFGGWIRAGYGKVVPQDFVLNYGGESYSNLFEGKGGKYELAPNVAEFIEAMRAEVDALTSAELLEFFTPRKEAAADKPKKAKKEAA